MLEKNSLICIIVFVALYVVTSGAVIFIVAKGGHKKEKKQLFDERQIAAQGFAYKVAFWTMLGYFLLYSISGAVGIAWCDSILGAFLGVIVGITVFAIICIFKDAYFRPDQSAVSMIVIINLLCTCQGILGFNNLSKGTLIENGALSGDAMPLFLFLAGVMIDVAIIVKHYKEKHKKSEGFE